MPATKESTSGQRNAEKAVFNVPNQLTAARFVLAIVLFVLIEWQMFLAATIVFVVAASTDWLDGYYARKYGQVTTLGRVFDPFVDKFIICGTFIYLVTIPGSGLVAWMAVLVVGREMFVTVLRSYIEQQGGNFSAKMAGKLKMVFQCGLATCSLYSLSYDMPNPIPEYGAFWTLTPIEAWGRPEWLVWTLAAFVWTAIISTVYSGVEYIFVAVRMLRK